MILSDATDRRLGVQRAEPFAGVRGPRIWGMQQRSPENSIFLYAAADGKSIKKEKGMYFLHKKGLTNYDDLRTMWE
jgi:hypothetical protein